MCCLSLDCTAPLINKYNFLLACCLGTHEEIVINSVALQELQCHLACLFQHVVKNN